MTPEFQLLPWERGGHAAAPSLEMSAIVEGRMRHFRVKTHEGEVYFRFADEDRRDARVWKLLDPEPQAPLERAFRAGVEANLVARVLVVDRGFSLQNIGAEFEDEIRARADARNASAIDWTCLMVAVSDNGRAIAQEWCGGRCATFTLPERFPQTEARRPTIWSRGWNVVGLRRALSPFGGQFAFRPFAPAPKDEGPLRFLRGSQQQLQTLFQAAHVHFITAYIAQNSTTGYWRFSSYSQSQPLRFSVNIQTETRQKGLSVNGYLPVVPSRLMDIFLAHNLPVGGEWRQRQWSNDQKKGVPQTQTPVVEFNKRLDFVFVPYSIPLKAEVVREPSAHERMEALLTLREWLEEKGYGNQIKQLLAI